MKRWALLTVALYLICISIISMPMFLSFSDTKDIVPYFYVFFVPVLLIIQIILLLIPVDITNKRPIKRRKVITSAIAGAFPIGIVALAFFGSIILIIWGENKSEKFLYNWPILLIPVFFWLTWGIIFYKSFSSDNPNSFISTITHWLLKGSILELLVAVPSHIISRQRDECCAPPLTLLGIVTGLSIAIMSFGPGIFFLFAKRIKEKMRKRR